MCGDMRSYLKRRITSRTLFWQYDSENSRCSRTVLVRHQHTHPRLALLDRAGRPPKAEARDMRPRAVLCEVVGPRFTPRGPPVPPPRDAAASFAATSAIASPSAASSKKERLKELKVYFDEELISEEEFKAKKASILSDL